MIKKISAIVLALVLCLSVVVVPVSAYDYTLASGSEVAYIVELDKEYYSAGDTVTVNIYLYGKEGLEFGTGALVIGMNSAIFDMSENDVANIKETGVGGDAMASWYKDVPNASWAWQTNATILNNISANNTEEENAMFDQYLKITLAKNTSGTHENIGSNKNGIPTEDINADTDAGIPFIQIQLKVRDDVADGTAVNVGIPTGPMAKNYTYMNYYKNPGSATTVVKTTAATSEVVFSTTAKIGEEPAEIIPLQLSHWKNQIRFDTYKDGTYSGTFDGRILMSIDNFDEVFETVANAETKVIDAGFIFAKSTNGTAMDAATAQAQVEGGAATYSQVKNAFVSTAFSEKDYVMSCMIENVKDADKATVSLSAMAYVVYTDANGKTAYAYSPVVTSTFEELYNNNFSTAFPA